MLLDGFRPPVLPADVAVVLGSKVQRNGTPSSGLQRRLERAGDLYRKGAVRAILVSGGRGPEGFEEADIMRAVLVQSGIPGDAIIVDRAGNNTRLTAIHARRIIQSRGWQSAVVISQYYHVPRAKLALRQEGVTHVSGAAAEYRFAWTDPLSIVREFAGFYTYLAHKGGRGQAAIGYPIRLNNISNNISTMACARGCTFSIDSNAIAAGNSSAAITMIAVDVTHDL